MSNQSNEQIRVCKHHPEYIVPLIWTFAFPGAEYWCPYCGVKGGMLGTGISVDVTPELIEAEKRYEEFSSEFLHANGIKVCYTTNWMGEQIDPNDLPQEEKDRLKSIIENWQYEVKLENIPAE